MEKVTFKIPNDNNYHDPELLPHGGKDRDGNVYAVDRLSLIKNGKRLLPVMGEFHYSRWEPETWEEELLRIKAGGVRILATYVFWIHHEEKEGEWDFSGRRDIGKFVRLCDKVGLKVWLRIGPWVHAECRHGGFPDWVQWSKTFEPRTNDQGYLDAVEKFFHKLGEQLAGQMCKDGGPVIGVQLENEYGHVGGPKDPAVRHAHMKKLLELAKKAGFVVPYYTATGWGTDAGMIEETLPVLGGYVDAPWDTTTKPMPASNKFLFASYRNDATIGTDRNSDDDIEVSENIRKYPYLSAELGGGLQVTSHRRPVCFSDDTEAHALCMLGSGVNLLGYYMYHGGINPDGKYTTLNETQKIGGYTTLPIKSYDFQACINEAGKLNDSYGAVKKYHLMIQDYEDELAGGTVIFPETVPADAEDMETIRATVRYNQKSGAGWVFINGHQRLRKMKGHERVCVELQIGEETLTLPSLTVETDRCYAIPFRLPVEDTVIEATNASLLCRLGKRTFFYMARPEEAVFVSDKPSAFVTVLTEEEANRAFKFADGLYVVENRGSGLFEQDGVKKLITAAPEERIRIYREDGSVETKVLRAESVSGEASFRFIGEEKDEDGSVFFREYEVTVGTVERSCIHNLYLNVAYNGDRAEVYRDGTLIDDWYTTGDEWNINLKRFGYPEKLVIRVYDSAHTIPCSFGQDVYYDLPVEAGCEMKRVFTSAEYLMCF